MSCPGYMASLTERGVCVCGRSFFEHFPNLRTPSPEPVPQEAEPRGRLLVDLPDADLQEALDTPEAREVGGEREPERELADAILAELRRARAKFPGDNVTMLALMEEVGELAKATFEESRENVRKEAVQVATMAMRVVLDGDATLDAWRAAKGLDALTGGER